MLLKMFSDFKNQEEIFNLCGMLNSGAMGVSKYVMLSLF